MANKPFNSCKPKKCPECGSTHIELLYSGWEEDGRIFDDCWMCKSCYFEGIQGEPVVEKHSRDVIKLP